MTNLLSLWLPILLSAVAVFLASSVIHMLSPWHKGDYPAVPDEPRTRAALSALAIPAGDYMVPRPTAREDMRSAEFAEKVRVGPNVILTVLPNLPWNMGRTFTQWFLYSVVVGLFAAYVASRVLAPGTDYLRVFQIVGATAFTGYALALYQLSIWFGRAWSTTLKSTVDGLIYALLTAGIFGWLWPR
jgi:hypothetical protein